MPADRVRIAALAAQAEHSPAYRIRVASPSQPLAGLGIDIDLLPLFDARQANAFASGSPGKRLAVALTARRHLGQKLRGLSGEVRTVLIQRQADMLPTLTLERQASRDRRLVLDIDDAIWHDGRGSRGHPLAALKGSRRKTDWLAERAEVVVAGNDVLAEYLSLHSRNVRVIPSLVDLEAAPRRSHNDAETLVVGWIGSSTTVGFLEAIRPALSRLAAALNPRRIELVVLGGVIAPIDGLATTVLPWSEQAERETLRRMDIGLMPLYDTPFSRGKCAYKALQYMASGIPVLAADVGISASVIGDGASGLIVREPGDWVDCIKTLADDADLRRRMGTEGRCRVRAGFSYERWLPELADVLGGD